MPPWYEHWYDYTGTASDLMMAGAAVFAAYRAYKWLHDKSSLNHLDTAHKFALEFENKLWETNKKIFSDVITRREIIRDIGSDLSINEESKIKIQEILFNSPRVEVENYASLKNHKMMFERYSIKCSINLSNILEELLDYRSQYTNAYNEWLSNLLKYNLTNSLLEEHLDESDIVVYYKKIGNLFENKIVKIGIEKDYSFS
ncbi:hypothetical protein CI789_12075 [Erwinia persicina]|uniref:hypothetical protein n=1 Tax=Erwinia persicina TaxID=55211 RepID=UPI000E4FBF6B|nr:hypothetical protein [Erwinia persicina]AXU95906.1 hypothetical protein CI789_12075 [Erwinia persicina]